VICTTDARNRSPTCDNLEQPLTENVMGKYFLAWLLGVPGGILLLVFLFTHVF